MPVLQKPAEKSFSTCNPLFGSVVTSADLGPPQNHTERYTFVCFHFADASCSESCYKVLLSASFFLC